MLPSLIKTKVNIVKYKYCNLNVYTSMLIHSLWWLFLLFMSNPRNLYLNLMKNKTRQQSLTHLFSFALVHFGWDTWPASVMYCRDMSLYTPKIEKPQPHNYRALWVFPNLLTILSFSLFIPSCKFSSQKSSVLTRWYLAQRNISRRNLM